MMRKKPTDAQVRAVIDAHMHSRVKGYRVVEHHCNSHVYVTTSDGDQVVVRICDGPYWTDDEARAHKFRREEHGWNLMSRVDGIHVPRVVAIDTSKQHVPYPFLIMTHVPGTPMSEVLPSLDTVEQLSLIRQLGNVVGRIHALAFDPGSMPKEAMRWNGNRESMEEDLAVLSDTGRMTRRARKHLEQFIAHHASLLASMDRDVVVLHGDIAFRNTLLEQRPRGWTVSGLVDAELAGYGPRGRELRVLEPLDFRPLGLPGMRAAFLDGYGEGFSRTEYKLAYLVVALDPDYPDNAVLEKLDSVEFSCDLDWLDVF